MDGPTHDFHRWAIELISVTIDLDKALAASQHLGELFTRLIAERRDDLEVCGAGYRLAFDSVNRRDTNVLLGILLMLSVTVIIANLITDMMYRVVDPRIRVGGGDRG